MKTIEESLMAQHDHALRFHIKHAELRLQRLEADGQTEEAALARRDLEQWRELHADLGYPPS